MDMSQLHTVSNSTAAPIQEFPSFIALICWHIWKARNARIFNNEVHSADTVIASRQPSSGSSDCLGEKGQ
jgi:hypothetical protein